MTDNTHDKFCELSKECEYNHEMYQDFCNECEQSCICRKIQAIRKDEREQIEKEFVLIKPDTPETRKLLEGESQ